MAWIESHQGLRTNPKAKRLARILDVPLPQAIGHLHMLWWWALDHAFEGELSKFDAFDIADAAGWDGDEEEFLEALINCGAQGRSGFIDRAASGHLHLHDWHEFTAYLRQRRESSARANHVRHHEKKGITAPDCEYCSPHGLRPDSSGTPNGSPSGTPHGGGTDSASPPPGTPPVPEPTDLPEPEPTGTGTEPDRPDQTPRARDDDRIDDTATNGQHPRGDEQAQEDQPDAYGRAVIGRLPDRVLRKINTDTERAVATLHTALGAAERAGIPPGRVYQTLNTAPPLDKDVSSVAATAASRIQRLVQEQTR